MCQLLMPPGVKDTYGSKPGTDSVGRRSSEARQQGSKVVGSGDLTEGTEAVRLAALAPARTLLASQ